MNRFNHLRPIATILCIAVCTTNVKNALFDRSAHSRVRNLRAKSCQLPSCRPLGNWSPFAVSNISMRKPNHWILKASVFLLSYSLACSRGTWGQAPVASATTPELYFWTDHSKQHFSLGEPVVIVLQLYSRSEQPISVSRLWGDEFVSFKLIGPDGNELPWQGEARAGSRGYSRLGLFGNVSKELSAAVDLPIMVAVQGQPAIGGTSGSPSNLDGCAGPKEIEVHSAGG
jgi:hypothetical protein